MDNLKKFYAVYHIEKPDPEKIRAGIYFRELNILNTYQTKGQALAFIKGRNKNYYFQFVIIEVYEFV